MNLIKWNDFDDSFPSLPTVLEDFFGRNNFSGNAFSRVSIPAVNIKEEDDKYIVTLAAPGLQKEDFQIKLVNGMLTIFSSKKDEKKAEKGKFSRYEYNFSSFSRSFSIPENINTEDIRAKYENGELKVELQKKEKTTAHEKTIEIE